MDKKVVGIITISLIILIMGVLVVILNSERKIESSNFNLSSEDSIINENKNEQINQSKISEEESNKVENIKIKVNNEVLNVKLEKNLSTETLVQKLKQGDITVNTHMYGGFEQVGSLGFSLPREDTNIITKSGDIMLYQGNQITLFYGSNSWSYTKLGEVTNKSNDELKNILGNGDVTLVLSID